MFFTPFYPSFFHLDFFTFYFISFFSRIVIYRKKKKEPPFFFLSVSFGGGWRHCKRELQHRACSIVETTGASHGLPLSLPVVPVLRYLPRVDCVTEGLFNGVCVLKVSLLCFYRRLVSRFVVPNRIFGPVRRVRIILIGIVWYFVIVSDICCL